MFVDAALASHAHTEDICGLCIDRKGIHTKFDLYMGVGKGMEYNTILNRFLFDATMKMNGRDTYDLHIFERRRTNFQCNCDGIDIN